MTCTDIVGVIPAYNPDETLSELVRALCCDFPLIVVDDGSHDRVIFEQIHTIDGVTVLTHAANRGKGAALKTAFQYILEHHPDSIGVVTLDADGQHLPADVVQVARHLRKKPASLVVGVRRFTGNVPLRSRLGNWLTRSVMRVFLNIRLTDTQTGLRGIPAAMLPVLIDIACDRYEFETEMLYMANKHGFVFDEVPIHTVYLNANQSSHFNPILDSLRIYWTLFRHMLAGVASAVVDYGVYLIVLTISGHILSSVCLGRLSSLLINFLLVKHFTFRSSSGGKRQFLLYLLQVLGMAFVTAYLVQMADSVFGIAPAASKIPVDILLYPVNFLIQRSLIFHTRHADEPPGQSKPDNKAQSKQPE